MGILDTLKGLFTKGKEVVDANGDGQVGLPDIQSAAQNLPETLQNLPQNVSEAAQNIPETLGNVTEQAKTTVEDLKDKLPQ